MSPKGKHRSEAQRRHDHLLHKSRLDPDAYAVASMGDMTRTIREHRERAHVVDMDTVRNRNMLISVQNQVCPLSTVNEVANKSKDSPGLSTPDGTEFKDVQNRRVVPGT